jgi:RND superfamily putative drug exporter
MLTSLASYVVRHAKAVLIISAIVLVGAGVVGSSAFGKLLTEGFDDPAAESVAANDLIAASGGETDLILLARVSSGTVDDPVAADAGAALTDQIGAQDGVRNVRSYWTTQASALKSHDATQALILVTLDDADKAVPLADKYTGDQSVFTVTAGGQEKIDDDIVKQVEQDLLVAESIAVPLILVLLMLAFGSVVAAVLPLAIGAVAILSTFTELSLLGSVTDVSVFAINLTTALGLGLAIDYALLVVSRFREELTHVDDVATAVIRTVETAGRTIVFSGFAVAAALATLLIFPMYFLRSFAYAGIGVVAVSVLSVLTVLPALLTVLGRRVNAGRVPWSAVARSSEAPLWGRLATTVMRRPLLITVPVIAVLLVAAAPLLGARFGIPDDRVLPTSAPSRQVGDAIRENFPAGEVNAVDVVLTRATDDSALAHYASQLSDLPGVEHVQSRVGIFVNGTAAGQAPPAPASDHEQLAVVTTADPTSNAALDLVDDVRAVAPPSGVSALVGGDTALLADSLTSIGDRLPIAIGLIVITTFVILFLFTGSIVQPIRALLSNALTLTATLGIMVLIFQKGAFSSVLGFTATPLNTSMLLLLFCIVFGLSMDYEVFVMSRIREQHEAGVDVAEATRVGLARTGRIVTTAAILLAVSFFAFVTGRVSFLKMFGLGSGLAVLLDATVVRGVLVPASMRLLGRHAWYAPRVLRRLHARVGLSER